MAIIIPVASGKGGAGKTTLTSSLAVVWAQRGQRVVAVDLDLGGSNLHTALGVPNTGGGLAAFIQRRETRLDALLMPTAWPGLQVIPGDGLLPGLMTLPFYIKKRLVQELSSLDADIVLLDLSAGASTFTLDFFLLAHRPLLVTLPETTAILNGYALLKAAAFRRLYLAFKKDSPERGRIEAFMAQRLEGTGLTLPILAEELNVLAKTTGSLVPNLAQVFGPAVVFNQFRDAADMDLGAQLIRITAKNLGIDLEDLGPMGWEPQARQAVNRRLPLGAAFPQSPTLRDLNRIADRLYPP